MRLAAQIGINRQRQNFRALFAFGVEAVELIDSALEQVVGLVVGDRHHRNVIELHRVGQRHQGAVHSADCCRFIIIDPIADIFDPGGGQEVRLSSVCVRPGPSQPRGRFPVKRSTTSSERAIIAF